MSKIKQIMAATLAMAAMAGGNNFFDTGCDYHRDPHEGETDEERKRRLHKVYGDQSHEHEFVIKGERIMARNKKTAMKIYANRHPEAKGKRRRNK